MNHWKPRDWHCLRAMVGVMAVGAGFAGSTSPYWLEVGPSRWQGPAWFVLIVVIGSPAFAMRVMAELARGKAAEPGRAPDREAIH